MKIQKLHIKNYKNLNAELVHNSDLIALIGNNGSGKSNLLEAVCYIFRSLYAPKYKLTFDYSLAYTTYVGNHIIAIDKNGKNTTYSIDGEVAEHRDVIQHLPKKVIGIYSGEETRLFDNCFKPFYQDFINNINRSQSQSSVYSDMPRMLYLNKYYWSISLLSLLISDLPDNQKFIKEALKITDTDSIRIEIDFIKRNYTNYNDNEALNLVKAIDHRSGYSLKEFKDTITEAGYIPDDVFKYLYLAYTPKDVKIIDGIIIKLSANRTVTEFSEGEKSCCL